MYAYGFEFDTHLKYKLTKNHMVYIKSVVLN